MTLEVVGVLSGLVLAIIAIGSLIYVMGQNNYRFSEEGTQRQKEDASIRQDQASMEKRFREELELRYATIRSELDVRFTALLKDINGIGQSSRALRALSDQRYHNSSLAHMVNAAEDKKTKIAGMLREEIHD